MAHEDNPLTANDKDTVLGRIKTIETLLAETAENDKIPEEDRVRMQASLEEQLSALIATATAQGVLNRRDNDEDSLV